MTREIKPLASKKTYFPSQPKWNETKKNPALMSAARHEIGFKKNIPPWFDAHGSKRAVLEKTPLAGYCFTREHGDLFFRGGFCVASSRWQ